MSKSMKSSTPQATLWQEEDHDMGMKETGAESPEQDSDLPTPPPFCGTPMMEKRLEKFREWAIKRLGQPKKSQ